MKKVSSFIVPIWMLAVVALDQLTKIMVLANFNLYESSVVIPGFFNLTYITNTGAAFGILAGEQSMLRQAFFIGVAMAALLVMFFSYRHFKEQGRMFVHGIGMIAGGAIGNLIDRLRYGSVVDFLDFHVRGYHWPAFNVADSAITVGVALFILGSLLAPPAKEAGGE
ncbi:MAG: signal peptidase II [Desulfobulbaceae bacterium]|nr:signal peptidase II [Desulfobulbaceae bacterium]